MFKKKKDSSIEKRFQLVHEESVGKLVPVVKVLKDTETGVLYAVYLSSSGGEGILTLLVDADGKPLVDNS